jgi:predicted HNH restriction endonuclease
MIIPRGLLPAYFTLVHQFSDNGWSLIRNLRFALDEILTKEGEEICNLPAEIPVSADYSFSDGAVVYVRAAGYERDVKARKRCLELKGSICHGCSVDFKKMYGHDISDIIEVHHNRPLAADKRRMKKNILKDLVPLCPNCHTVVHSFNNVMSLIALQRRTKSSR